MNYPKLMYNERHKRLICAVCENHPHSSYSSGVISGYLISEDGEIRISGLTHNWDFYAFEDYDKKLTPAEQIQLSKYLFGEDISTPEKLDEDSCVAEDDKIRYALSNEYVTDINILLNVIKQLEDIINTSMDAKNKITRNI